MDEVWRFSSAFLKNMIKYSKKQVTEDYGLWKRGSLIFCHVQTAERFDRIWNGSVPGSRKNQGKHETAIVQRIKEPAGSDWFFDGGFADASECCV